MPGHGRARRRRCTPSRAPRTAASAARWRLILLIAGGLALAGGGYAAGRFLPPATPPPHLSKLVVTGTALPAGARITAADLRTVTVHPGAGEPGGAIGPAAAAGLVGLVTRAALPPGTFLERSLLAPGGAVPGVGQALVGLALKPGTVPAGGLADGQRVLRGAGAHDARGCGAAADPVPHRRRVVQPRPRFVGNHVGVGGRPGQQGNRTGGLRGPR